MHHHGVPSMFALSSSVERFTWGGHLVRGAGIGADEHFATREPDGRSPPPIQSIHYLSFADDTSVQM
jgi:hypothetical protein